MLNAENRLRKKKEFSYIYKKGRPHFAKHLTLYEVKTKRPQIKVGFSVNNKVGNSVIRHKVKRRLSEIVRQRIKMLPRNNYIFVAKIGSDALTFEQLTSEVELLIEKIKNEK